MPQDGSSGKGAARNGRKKDARPPARDESPRSPNRVEVARAADTIIIKVIGLGSVNNAGALWDFATQCLEEGCRRFALELTECRGMDSTFLGTVVGISQEAKERFGEAWVCVFNCSRANRELFEIVGADRYVRFTANMPMKPIETEPLSGCPMNNEKRLALVRRAHENLVSIDQRNQERFGEFLRSLAAELAKRSDEKPPAEPS